MTLGSPLVSPEFAGCHVRSIGASARLSPVPQP
jgi:hypothetical protein